MLYEFLSSTNNLQSEVLIQNQNFILRLTFGLKLQKIPKNKFQIDSTQNIQEWKLEDDFSTSFSLIFEDEKNIRSQKVGLAIHKNDQTIVRCIFSNSDDVSLWESNLKCFFPQKRFHDNFKALRMLGKGTQGTVYLTKSLYDDHHYAVKGISKQKLDMIKNGKQGLINQCRVLRSIDNDNLIKLYGVWESQKTYYLQFSLESGHSLLQVLSQLQTPLPQQRIKMILKGVLKGLQYLAKKRIIHRDIKPDNIMISEQKVSIVDMGLATNADQSEYIFQKCGTPGFIAPEIVNLQFHENIDPKCDIFSLGSIFHIMLTGKVLFSGKNVNQVIIANRQCNFNLQDTKYERVNKNGMDLLKKMLTIDPTDRINASEALNHIYLRQ